MAFFHLDFNANGVRAKSEPSVVHCEHADADHLAPVIMGSELVVGGFVDSAAVAAIGSTAAAGAAGQGADRRYATAWLEERAFPYVYYWSRVW